MAFRRMFERLRAPIEEIDRAALREWTAEVGSTPIAEVVPRQTICVAGEASSVRIVPRAGSPSLEVTVTDGTGFATGVFLGRRRIAGITPGRRLRFEGVASRKGRIIEIFNPRYDILR
ncbi:MAG: DNA-binding protein [Acidimicrobiia bacterium]